MKAKLILAYHLFVPLLVFITIAVQFADNSMSPAFRALNFFSFFTIQSNIFASIILFYGGVMQLKGKKLSRRYELLRGAAVLYMSVTGIVFALLLSQIQADLQLALPWVDAVLHKVMPLIMLLDWVATPPVKKMMYGQIKWWLIYPAAYLIYSLIRGPIVGWYPYPFLDPNEAGGYGGIALYALGIAVAVITIGYLMVLSGNKLRSLPK